MAQGNNINGAWQPVSNAMVPKEGPKILSMNLDFTAGVLTNTVDLSQNVPQQISFVQGAFVDNSQNAQQLIIICKGTAQRVVVPPQSQMYVPLFAGSPPIFQISSLISPGVIIPIYFTNVPLPAEYWSVVGASGGFIFNGSNLLVQDTAAETSLAALETQASGAGLNVNVVSGGASTPYNEGTKTYNLTGTSHSGIYAASAGQKFVLVSVYAYLTGDAYCASLPAGGGPWSFSILDDDTSVTIFEATCWMPGVPPTSAATGAQPLKMAEASNINYKGASSSDNLINLFTSATLTAGTFNVTLVTRSEL